MMILQLTTNEYNVSDLKNALVSLGYRVHSVSRRGRLLVEVLEAKEPIEAYTTLRRVLLEKFSTDYAIRI